MLRDVCEVSGKSRSPKSLEEKLIEEALIESSKVHSGPSRIRAIDLEHYGAGSIAFKYIDGQLKGFEHYLDLSTWVFQKFEDLLTDTAIIGRFSEREFIRKFLFLVEKIGLEKARRLIEQYEAKSLPENVISLSKYREKLEMERLFRFNDKPKGAA